MADSLVFKIIKNTVDDWLCLTKGDEARQNLAQEIYVKLADYLK